MNIEFFRSYCMSKKGVTESFPFPQLPDLLVFKVGGKMFTATNVFSFEAISLRFDPDIIQDIREQYPSITRHTYFSNRHWSLVIMDSSICHDTLLTWLDASYEIALGKLTKRVKRQLLSFEEET